MGSIIRRPEIARRRRRKKRLAALRTQWHTAKSPKAREAALANARRLSPLMSKEEFLQER